MLGNDLFQPDAHAEPERELTRRIHAAVLRLLSSRKPGATICPGDAARAVARELACEWRDLMRPVRHVAAQMVDQGLIEVIQHGGAVSIEEARGPLRMRRRRPRYS